MANTLSVEVGKRIRVRREELGMTREQLAERCDLSVTFCADIESGRKGMSAKSLYKIARVLNLSSDYILFGNEAEVNKTRVETMLASLSKKDRELAESIIESFVKAVSDKVDKHF